ncbi:MAG TPA: NHL repeat-containing protein, partial [Pyrinomonadaceae bacterium]|nr:NHL repeat-containing protein [Pyrinomonadaceae bacterium]
MSDNSKDNFRFLNVDGLWPAFKWEGLELGADGTLQLQTVPLLEGAELIDDSNNTTHYAPAGIAVAQDGAIYFSDPLGQRVLRIDPCDGAIGVVPCMGGEGSRPRQFNLPRGLLIPKYRDSLFVADSANHRIQVFDLASNQLVDIQGDSAAAPAQPSDQPGRFNAPWTLAGDQRGNLYVVDYNNKRVQKFNRTGELEPSFWETVDHCSVLKQPVDIAVHSSAEETRVYVVDAVLHCVFIFDEEGNLIRTPENNDGSFGAEVLIKPLGITASKDAVYVGDNERHAILKFKRSKSYRFIGEAIGYHAPVLALAMLDDETLLVHSGGSVAPRRLSVRKGFRTRGAMWSSAISVSTVKTQWHRVEVEMRRLAAGAHLRLFVSTSNNRADAPVVDNTKENPFADPKWRRAITPTEGFADLSDMFVGGEPSRFIWIGALFSSEGRATPVVSQIRLEFDHEGYIHHLPVIYRNDSACKEFLQGFLSLFESLFSDVED